MVEYYNAGGKERPFLFSYRAYKYLIAEMQKGETTDDDIELMIYCGFKAGAARDKKSVDFTREDIADWLDDDMELFESVVPQIQESMPRLLALQKKMAGEAVNVKKPARKKK